jgi:hypothetical protein
MESFLNPYYKLKTWHRLPPYLQQPHLDQIYQVLEGLDALRGQTPRHSAVKYFLVSEGDTKASAVQVYSMKFQCKPHTTVES